MAVDKYPMAFDAGNITLTIWGNNTDPNYDYMGYDEATAFNFDQIKEFAIYTDPTLASERGFIFKFVIALIKKTADQGTWLVDKNKQITFTREKTGDALKPTIQIGNYTHLRLGELIDAEKKITTNGCQILVTKVTSYDGGIGKGSTSYSYVELYGCDINFAPHYSQAAILSNVSAKVYNCSFIGGGVYQCEPELFNCNIISAGHAVYYASPVIDNVAILNSGSLFRIRNITQCVNARGVYARGYDYVLSIYTAAANNNIYASLVDCDLETWGTISGYPAGDPAYINYLYRKNSINIKLRNPEGAAIEGAAIVITDSAGDVVMEKTSDETGAFEEQIIEVQRWTVNGLNQKTFTDFNPFTITITKEGKQTYVDTVEILDKINWEIVLLPIPATVFIDRRVQGQIAARQITGTTSVRRLTGVVRQSVSIVTKKEIEGEVHT